MNARVAALVAAAVTLVCAVLLFVPGRAQAQASGVRLVGVQGVLRAASGQPFTTVLIADSGRTFGLLGETDTVNQQILQLRQVGARVEVDGTLYTGGLVSNMDEIVVTRIVSASAQPDGTPAPTRPTVVVNGPVVNVRSGPGTGWPVVGQVEQGTVCSATGRNGDLTWLQNSCPDVQGWISATLLVLRGEVDGLPVVTPPPLPEVQPTPSFPNWRASYFDNPTLGGEPVIVRNEPQVNFQWGFASPDPRVPVDNYSARFESTQAQTPGLYNITVTVDDGVRVWIDNQLVIDEWRIGSERQLVAQRQLGASAAVRIEYFEAQGLATVVFAISPAVAPPQPSGVTEAAPGQDTWGFAYWNNIDFQGQPAVSGYTARAGSGLSFNWGLGAPAAGAGDDNWSARFRGRFNFAAGNHTFTSTSDDGVRVRIDGIVILDRWTDGHGTVTNRFDSLGAGWHLIEVEYFERGGLASLQVGWSRDTGSTGGGGAADQPHRDE